MKISLNWLRDYVDLPKNLNHQELADKLSLHVVEVEGFEREEDQFANMVVGRIIEIRNHPNADRLKVCLVGIGKLVISNLQFPISNKIPNAKSQIIEIVCGGKNLREGMAVAVALPGSRVRWHGEGELVELKETEIRGVKSFGMICAGSEIDLDDLQKVQPVVGDGPQILDLDFALRSPGTVFSASDDLGGPDAFPPQKLPRFASVKPGIALADALGKDDVVFEISNVSLSNRPDLWSHYGMAREIAVLYGKKLKTLKLLQRVSPDEKKYSTQIKIHDPKLCRRYLGVTIENVAIAPSPLWLQRRLQAIGQRPINNIVDITNYVMFDVGEPTHAFDISRLTTSTAPGSKMVKVVVRRAKDGEKIVTLDDKERTLDRGMLLITDGEKPIAIAGVMGGVYSEVGSETKKIFLEVANFDPVSIRLTSQKLGLRTEGSIRWEKGLDPHLAEWGMKRMLALIREIMPQARIVSPMVDVGSWKKPVKPISISHDLLTRRIGTSVSVEKVKKILQALGFHVRFAARQWIVTPPSWRATRDISLPEDIVEEVARHWGYNRIPDSLPSFSIAPPPPDPVITLERAMKRALVGLWFAEVEHKPFVNPRWWEKFGLETGEHVTIVNPIDPEARYLRQSLIPGLLQDVKDNRREHEELKLFEWGRVLIPIDGEYLVKKGAKDKLPYQPYHLTFVVAANVTSEAMLRHVKGVMIALLSVAGFTAATVVSRESRPYFIRGSYFDIITGNNVGEGGVASPALRKELDLGERESLGIVTIDITALIQQQKDMLRYRPLPLYPAVRRDVAFVIDDVLPYRAVEEVIARYKQGSLEQFELFDVYQAQGLPHGKKSLAFHLTFRDSERTLTTQEVEGELGRIIRALRDMCGAVIRG